jgi:hypothetical protein
LGSPIIFNGRNSKLLTSSGAILNPDGSYAVNKSNFTAVVNPSVNDDLSAGYTKGSQWVNTAANTYYICFDNTNGAAEWIEFAQPFVGFKETPAGLVNGINTAFDITHTPIDGTLVVFLNGLELDESDISSYVHPTINLVTPPAIGQTIEVYYATSGTSATIQLDVGNEVVENRTITAGEITAKEITLVATPSVASKTKVDVRGGSPQVHGLDFVVTGDVLSWNGYDLYGQLVAGSILRIVYFS